MSTAVELGFFGRILWFSLDSEFSCISAIAQNQCRKNIEQTGKIYLYRKRKERNSSKDRVS